MNDQRRDQAIALAAVFQSIHLVRQVADGRKPDQSETRVLLGSRIDLEPETPEGIYGDIGNLHTGLDLLVRQTGNTGSRDLELTRYAVLVLHLERKLSRHKELLDLVATGIGRVREQTGFFDILHPNVIASLADIYKQTVSTLQPRIMVKGEPAILETPDNRNLIRALLLAAIRAAVLWRQRGGNRLTLVFGRKAILAHAKEMLAVQGPHGS